MSSVITPYSFQIDESLTKHIYLSSHIRALEKLWNLVYDNHIWNVLLLSSGGKKAIKVIESIKLSSEGLRGLILTFSQSTFSTVGNLTRNSVGCLLWLFLWCFWSSASKSLRDLSFYRQIILLRFHLLLYYISMERIFLKRYSQANCKTSLCSYLVLNKKEFASKILACMHI